MFAVFKNVCVGSSGLGLGKCLPGAEYFYKEAQAYS